jgi:hypothetical protein
VVTALNFGGLPDESVSCGHWGQMLQSQGKMTLDSDPAM